MKAICVDGTSIDCENFKAVRGGVVLTGDRKRKHVVGFVPNGQLRYVLPDDVAERRANDAEASERSAAKREPLHEVPPDAPTPPEIVAGGTDDDAFVSDDVVLDDVGAPVTDPEEDLRRLAGLGDTYAARLRAGGVETVSDLRRLSVEDVSRLASVPVGRAERWLRLVNRPTAAEVGERDGDVHAEAGSGFDDVDGDDADGGDVDGRPPPLDEGLGRDDE